MPDLLQRFENIERLLQAIGRKISQIQTEASREQDPDPLKLLRQQLDAQDAGAGLLLAWVSGRGRASERSRSNTQTDADNRKRQASGPADHETIAAAAVPFSSMKRITIMDALTGESLAVSELREVTGLTEGQLYHHLRELRETSMVSRNGQGEHQLTAAGLISYMLVGELAMTQNHLLRSED